MSYREPERDEGPDYCSTGCAVCELIPSDHPIEGDPDWTHDWQPPTDNSPDEPDED